MNAVSNVFDEIVLIFFMKLRNSSAFAASHCSRRAVFFGGGGCSLGVATF